MPDSPLVYVETLDALIALRDTLAAQPAIAVDTEANSLYAYFEKVCLLQFSTHDADYIVDPLALASSLDLLAPIFADARIEKIFHAAEYDILCLKRDFHFTFANIFDTMIAARILGWANVGLGNILRERFGIVLNKKMQRADWGTRPLPAAQLAYAREDTHYLLALRDAQAAELERLERAEEAREEFERLTHVEPTPRQFDPEGYWHLKGARELTAAQLGVLRELFHWREAQARREDRPPFKILADATLIRLAGAAPTTPRTLARVEGVTDFIARRYHSHLLAAIQRGLDAPQTTRPHPRARSEPFLTSIERARLGRLKEWRRQRAQARGVDTDVIVSNEVLLTLARRNPRTLEGLAAATGLGAWKARTYGAEMLRVLHGKEKQDAESRQFD